MYVDTYVYIHKYINILVLHYLCMEDIMVFVRQCNEKTLNLLTWMYRLCMEVSTYIRIYVRMYIWSMPRAGEAQFFPPLFTVGIGS